MNGRARGRVADAVLLALVAAFLLSVYPPLAPPLAIAAALAGRTGVVEGRSSFGVAAEAWPCSSRARRPRSWSWRSPTCARCRAGSPPWRRCAWGDTSRSLRSTGSPSRPASLPGAGPPEARGAFCRRWPRQWLCLLLLGTIHLGRTARTRVWPVVFLALAGALGYYALFVTDPWTGRTGHTWSAFKLVQWSYPLVFLLQCAGMLPCRRDGGGRRRRWRSCSRWPSPRSSGLAPSGPRDEPGPIMRTRRPLDQVTALRRGLRGLPPGRVVLLGRETGPPPVAPAVPRTSGLPAADPEGRGRRAPGGHRAPSLPAPHRAGPAAMPIANDAGGPCAGPGLGLRSALPAKALGRRAGHARPRQGAAPVLSGSFSSRRADGRRSRDRPPPKSAAVARGVGVGRDGHSGRITAGPALRWRVPLELPAGLTRLELIPAGETPGSILSPGRAIRRLRDAAGGRGVRS